MTPPQGFPAALGEPVPWALTAPREAYCVQVGLGPPHRGCAPLLAGHRWLLLEGSGQDRQPSRPLHARAPRRRELVETHRGPKKAGAAPGLPARKGASSVLFDNTSSQKHDIIYKYTSERLLVKNLN